MTADAQSPTVIFELAKLFERDKSVISHHLSNIQKAGEPGRKAVVAKNATVQQEGALQVRRSITLYKLDPIISVGYRVDSRRATRFRQWATRTLCEHLTRGWILNRQRFEESARELEAAITLVRKAARSPALDADSGRAPVDIIRGKQ